jgi:hydroxymethylpyrimidine pyrophosphatase-like HAD family hydrolase
MGNAPDEVKTEARHVTASNEDDGFAKAVDYILAEQRG